MWRLDIVHILTCCRRTNLGIADLTDNIIGTGDNLAGCKCYAGVAGSGLSCVLLSSFLFPRFLQQLSHSVVHT